MTDIRNGKGSLTSLVILLWSLTWSAYAFTPWNGNPCRSRPLNPAIATSPAAPSSAIVQPNVFPSKRGRPGGFLALCLETRNGRDDTTSSTTTTTAQHDKNNKTNVIVPNGSRSGDDKQQAWENMTESKDLNAILAEVGMDERNRLETALLFSPALMGALAFSTYTFTSEAFHATVDYASGHTWAAVDGGTYLTDLITPALTGPVASFISLLFGTLTSMTVSSLYNRQATMAQLLAHAWEDLRLMEIHVSRIPSKTYQRRARRLIREYGSVLMNSLEETTEQVLNRRREASRGILEQLVELLHQVSEDEEAFATAAAGPGGKLPFRAMDESYATINRLLQTHMSFWTTYQTSFPPGHYANLSVLAMAICFIFLVLTDKTALLFLGGFQLKLCWAMLIGTFTMLGVVIYDLNTPLSGAFQCVQPPIQPSQFNSILLKSTTHKKLPYTKGKH